MKKFSLFFSICLSIFMVFGSFSIPTLAYENKSVNLEQVKTETTLNNDANTLNKINLISRPANDFSQNLLVTQKGKTGLEKSQQIEVKTKDYVDGEILVKYKNNKINLQTISGKAAALNFINSKSLEKKEDLIKNNISVLRIKDTKTVEQKIAELKNDPNVEYVEPNYRRYPAVINTNDTNKSILWGLDNTGQTINGSYGNITGTNDADIDAPEAWAISGATTSVPVIVAVIDSGVAYNHPDLVANMWDGSNCKDENGNALGGCNYGYDYEDNDKTPLPSFSSHGTHIAGTIAAAINNGKGIIGVAPNAKIMAIKYGFNVASEIKSIDFAIQNGAKVINASFDGTEFSQSEYDAINRFKTAGGILIAAAGNESTNNESVHLYPSDYNLDNIISTAATDQNDALATFSNYGITSVDVGAPGTNIYSTVPSETAVVSESFESLTPPNIPSGWIKGGANNNWGTYSLDSGTFWGKVLYGDLAYPYADNRNTTITSPVYNLSIGGANIDFWTKCDTEYITDGWADYMQLEYSADGVNFSPAVDPFFGGEFRWDEPTLDILNEENPLNSANGALFHYSNISIPAQYLTSNFKFRFRWVTNASNNNYDGCLVDDVKITKFSDGSDEKYDYSDGTSMATPHVAGLTALVEGYNPGLSLIQVKNIILTMGDSLSSLSGKTVSGKRINVQKTLQAANPAKAITAFSFATPVATGVIDEITHTITLTVPFGTDVTALIPTIATSTGSSVSPASGVVNNFTATSTYTVTAADGSTQAYAVAVTVAPAASHTISGIIKYYDGIKVIPNATVILENSIGTQIATTTTNTSGAYQFTEVANGGNYVVRVSKDDNFSSTGVTVSDLIVIKKHTLGTELTDIYEKIAADFNSSQSITVSDLIMLKKFTLERIDGRPASSWRFYSSNVTPDATNYLTVGQTRTYSNLTANTPNQDFVGIKMGDVNNSWVSN
ncbi:MAG: S8 family serine peptidase [Candidatus Paceibacterota bacterium]